MEVTLLEMLEARERRVERQRRLLEEYHATLVCFTMNIAGPVKNSPLIRRGFVLGRRLLEEQFRVAGKAAKTPETKPFSWWIRSPLR